MAFALRSYQETAIADVRAAFRAGHRAVLLVMPTGGGKTPTFAHVVASITGAGQSALILCHRRELIKQASAKLSEARVPHGLIARGLNGTGPLVQVGSIQTVARRMEGLRKYQWIVLDEAHHAVAGQWATLVASQPQARVLGVTATPERLDGRGLGRACRPGFSHPQMRRTSRQSARAWAISTPPPSPPPWTGL